MAKANNLAYDYSIYEPVPQQLPVKRIQVRKNNAEKSVSAVKALVTAVAAFFLLCAILYGKVEISQTFNQTSDLTQQLAVLNNENTRLQTDLEAKTSISNVEDYAENVLGLKKLDISQREYIEIEKENVIGVVDDSNKNPFVEVKNWVSNILEYIGA